MSAIQSKAVALLRKNWAIFIPSLVAGFAAAASAYELERAGLSSLGFFANLNGLGPQAFAQYAQSMGALGLRVFWVLVASALTAGAAGAAWKNEYPAAAGAFRALRANAAQSTLVFVLLLLVGLAAAALVVPTFGLSIVLFALFTLYAFPATIIGGRPATDAIVDSIRIASRHVGVSLAVVLPILAAAAAFELAGWAAVSWPAMELAAAYATLVAAGVYLKE